MASQAKCRRVCQARQMFDSDSATDVIAFIARFAAKHERQFGIPVLSPAELSEKMRKGEQNGD